MSQRNHEVTTAHPLLKKDGSPAEPGWSKRLVQVYDRKRGVFAPLDPNAVYRVVGNAFTVVEGGDGFVVVGDFIGGEFFVRQHAVLRADAWIVQACRNRISI